MARGRATRKAPCKPMRLHDSGFASDDDRGVTSSASSDYAVASSPPVRTLLMTTLRNTDWDFGTSTSRYARDELQLMQPDGFPIIPLDSTLARAREEAEGYSGPEFSIYEDADVNDNALPKIAVTDTIEDKASRVIDSRGRTRAASKRLGLDGVTAPDGGFSEGKENAAQADKKHKRGGTQAGKQPRNQA